MTTTPKGQINAPDQLDCMSTLRTEHLEQSRLLGMSGERECALLGEIERKDKALRVALDALETAALNDPARNDDLYYDNAIIAVKDAL